MSQSIDERVVKMRFDNSQFDSRINASQTALNKFNSFLDKATSNAGKSAASFNQLGAAAAANVSNFVGLNNSVDKIANAFGSFNVGGEVVRTTIDNITNAMIRASGEMVKYVTMWDQVSAGWTKYDNKTQSVQTIMSATGKSIDEVTNSLAKLNWFTDETSFNYTDMVDNIGKFTAAGVDLDDAVSAMMGIANEAAISGQNAQAASRAMYNFAQAMGVGSVKLMDWKSIENANMATVEFKQTILDTAEALGTIKKTADGAYYALAGGDEFDAASFSTELSQGWFTGDVLVETLKRYSEFAEKIYDVSDAYDTASEAIAHTSSEGMELGARAFAAAQEAKTFSEAIESVNDAVSTGWMNTFEVIFGNYEEAKVLWTDVANDLWDIFASSAEGRNDVLAEAMEDPLDQFYGKIEEVGVDVEQFKNVVIEQAKSSGIAIDYLIDQYGDLDEVIKAGALNTDILNDSLFMLSSRATAGAYDLDDAEIAYNNFIEAVKDANLESFEAIGKYDEGLAKLERMGYQVQGNEQIIKDILDGNIRSWLDLTDAEINALMTPADMGVTAFNSFREAVLETGATTDSVTEALARLESQGFYAAENQELVTKILEGQVTAWADLTEEEKKLQLVGDASGESFKAFSQYLFSYRKNTESADETTARLNEEFNLTKEQLRAVNGVLSGSINSWDDLTVEQQEYIQSLNLTESALRTVTDDAVEAYLNSLNRQIHDLDNVVYSSTAASNAYDELSKTILDTAASTGRSIQMYAALDEAGYEYTKGIELVKKVNEEGVESLEQFKDEELQLYYQTTAIQKILDGTVTSFTDLSEEEQKAVVFTDEYANALRNLTTEGTEANDEIKDLLNKITRPSGRELLSDIITGSLEQLYEIMVVIGDAWTKVIPSMASENIYEFLETLKDLVEGFKLGERETEILQNVIKGIANVFKAVTTVVSALVKSVVSLVKPLGTLIGDGKSLSENFLNVCEAINAGAESFANWIEKTDAIKTGIEAVIFVISRIIEEIKLMATKIVNALDFTEEIKIFEKLYDTVYNKIKSFFDNLSNLNETTISRSIHDFFSKLTSSVGMFLEQSDSLEKARDNLKEFMVSLTEVIKGQTVEETNAELEKFRKILIMSGTVSKDAAEDMSYTELSIAKFVLKIKKHLKEFAEAIEEKFGVTLNYVKTFFKQFADGIKDFVDNVVGDKLKSVKELFINVFSGLIEWIGKAAATINEWLPYINDALSKFFGIIKNAVESFDWDKTWNKISGFAEAISNFFTKIRENIAKANEQSKNGETPPILETIANISKKLGEVGIESMTNAMTAIKDAIGGFVQWFLDSFKDATVQDVVVLMFALSVIGLIRSISKLLSSTVGVVDNIKTFGDSLRKSLDSLSGAIKDFGKGHENDWSEKLMNMAKAIAILTIVVIALTQFDGGDLAKSLITLGVLLAAILVFTILITKFTNSAGVLKDGETQKSLRSTVGLVLAMTIALTAISVALIAMTNLMDFDNLALAAISITLISVIVGLLTLVAAKLSEKSGDLGKSLGSAVVIIALAFSISKIASALSDLATISWSSLIGSLGNVLIVFTVFALLSIVSSNISLSSSLGVLILVAAIKIIVSTLQEAGKVIDVSDISSIVGDIKVVLILVIGMLIAMFALAKIKFGDQMKSLGTGVLLSVSAILILALAIKQMKEAVAGADVKTLVFISGIILMFFVFIGVMAVLSSTIKDGSQFTKMTVGIIAISMAVLVLVGALNILTKNIDNADSASLGLAVLVLTEFLAILVVLIAVSSLTKDAKIGPILSLVAALAIIMAGLAVLTALNPIKLLASTIAVGGVMIALIALVSIISKMPEVDSKPIKAISGLLIILLGSLILLSSSLTDTSSVLVSMGAMMLIMATLIVLCESIAKSSDSLSTAVKSIVVLSVFIGLLCGTLIALVAISDNVLTVVGIAVTLGLFMFAMVKICEQASKMQSMTAGAIVSLVAMGIVIKMVAGAISTISSSCKNVGSVVASAVMIFALLEAMLLVMKQANKINSFASGTVAALVGMCLVVDLLAVAISVLAKIDSAGSIITSAIGIGVVLAALTVSLKVISELDAIGLQSAPKAIMSMAAVLAVIAVAFAALSFIGSDPMQLVVYALSIASVLLAMAAVMYIASQIENVGKAAGSILAMAATIAIIAAALGALTQLGDFDNMAGAVISIAVVTILMGVLMGVMATMGDNAVKGAAAVLLMGVSCALIAGSLAVLANFDWHNILAGAAALCIVAVVCAFACMIANEGLIGAAALVVMGIACIAFAGAIAIIAGIDTEKVWNAVGAIAAMVVVIVVLGLIANVAAVGIAVITAAFVGIAAAVFIISEAAMNFAVAVMLIVGALALLQTMDMATVTANLTALAGAIPDALAAFGEGLVENIESIKETILTLGETVLEVIGELIPEAVETLWTLIDEFFATMEEHLPSITDNIMSTFLQFMTQMSTYIPQITEQFMNMLLGIMTEMHEYVPQIVDEFQKMIIDILNVMGENIGPTVEAAATFIANFLNGLAENLPQVIEAGTNLICSLIQGIADSSVDIIDAAFQAITTFIDGLATAIDENHEDFEKAVSHLFESALTAVTSFLNGDGMNKLKEAARTVLEGMKATIKDRIDSIKESVKEKFNGILEYLRGLWEDLKTIGEFIFDGLKEGLSVSWENIKSFFDDAWDWIVTTVKTAFGIASPSKLFRKFGGWMMEGLGLGVEDETEYAVSTMEGACEQLIDPMAQALQQANDLVSDISANPTITPVVDLSDVESSASRISGLFDQQQLNFSNVNFGGYASLQASRVGRNDDSNIQNGGGNQVNNVTYTFNQTNNSPKALSRIDIYRQTRNQFSQLAGAGGLR